MSYAHLTKLAHQVKHAYSESPTGFMNSPEEVSKINKELEAYAKKRGTTLANLQGPAFNESLESVLFDALNKPENIKRLNTELERTAKSRGTTLANLQGAEFGSALKSARSNMLSGLTGSKSYDVGRAMAQEDLDKREKRILKLREEHEGLKKQLKEQRQFEAKRRKIMLGTLGVGIPTTIAASVLMDKYLSKKR